MKKQSTYILVLLATVAVLASCNNNLGYEKTKSGLLYKLIRTTSDSVVKDGDVIKFNVMFKRERGDSVLNTSYGKMPAFLKVSSAQAQPYSLYEIFPLLHNGDSAVIVQFVDSLTKRNPMEGLPPFLKKSDKIIATIKMITVFKSDSLANADRAAEIAKETARAAAEQAKDLEEGLKTQVPEMEKWLSSKGIKAQKTGKGTYVVVTDPGTGMQADSGKYVSVRYAGRTLKDGKQFESTMDTSAHPYSFVLGTRSAIAGWDEGLKLFKKGGKGTLYIPGALAYGKNPPPGSPFGPNEALIFDIVMEDVAAAPPAPQMPSSPVPQQAKPTDTKKKK